MDMIGDTCLGFKLLKQVLTLSDELYSGPHTLKNPRAYLLRERGLMSCGRIMGGQRVMSRRMFSGWGEGK